MERSRMLGWTVLSATCLLLGAMLLPLAQTAMAEEHSRGITPGTFVKLAEVRIGEREYISITVKNEEGESTFYLGRQNAAFNRAKQLKEGQAVTVSWVSEGERMWVSGLEVAGGEGDKTDKPDAPTAEGADALRKQVRELQEQVASMKKRLAALQEENTRLRRQLSEAKGEAVEKPAATNDGPDAAPALPDGFAGFRGLLTGKVESKGERTLVVKVESIAKSWENSTAEKPQAAVGQSLTLRIGRDRRALVEKLSTIKVGDTIVVGVMNGEGNVLQAVEDLRKAE